MEANHFFHREHYWLDPGKKRLPPPMFFQSEFEKNAFLKNRMEESLMKSAFRFHENHRDAAERSYKQQVNFMHSREAFLRSRATSHEVIIKFAGTPHEPRELTLEKIPERQDSREDDDQFVSILMPRLVPKEKPKDNPIEKKEKTIKPATSTGLRGFSAPPEKQASRRPKTAFAGTKHPQRPVSCHSYGQSSAEMELRKQIKQVLEQKDAEKAEKKPVDCNAAVMKVKEELSKTIADTSKFVKELRREIMLENLLQPPPKKTTHW